MKNLIFLFIIVVILWLPFRHPLAITVEIAVEPTPTLILTEKPQESPHSGNVMTVAEVKSAIVSLAGQFGIRSETFSCVIQNESGFRSRRPDGSLKCGDGGASCGLGQIQLPTWQSMRRHAGWSTDDLRHDDYENLKTTAYGLSTLWAEHWTAYRFCHYQLGLSL